MPSQLENRVRIRTNAGHLRPSRRISREVRVHNLKIEFEFELDFSRVDPCRAKCELGSQLRQKERACFSRKMRYVTQFCLSFVFNDLRHNKSWYGGSDRRLFGTVQLQPLLWQLGTGSTSTVESKQYQLSGRSAAW